jgi:hypothetical protein
VRVSVAFAIGLGRYLSGFAEFIVLKLIGARHVRFGSWLCKNAKMLNRDRRSYSSKAALVTQLAGEFDLEIKLKNIILVTFRFFEFLHSQGQTQKSKCSRVRSALPQKQTFIAINAAASWRSRPTFPAHIPSRPQPAASQVRSPKNGWRRSAPCGISATDDGKLRPQTRSDLLHTDVSCHASVVLSSPNTDPGV